MNNNQPTVTIQHHLLGSNVTRRKAVYTVIFNLSGWKKKKDYVVVEKQEDDQLKNFLKAVATTTVVTAMTVQSKLIHAAPGSGLSSAKAVAEKTALSHVLDPLLVVLQGLSVPLFSLMCLSGLTMIMLGRKHKGIEMIKWAVIGYLGIQMLPSLANIILNVGTKMSAIN